MVEKVDIPSAVDNPIVDPVTPIDIGVVLLVIPVNRPQLNLPSDVGLWLLIPTGLTVAIPAAL